MSVAKISLKAECPPPEVSKKDLEYLVTICNMAKQIINGYDTPHVRWGLQLAFSTDLLLPEKMKDMKGIVDEDVKEAYEEYVDNVRGKLYERGII